MVSVRLPVSPHLSSMERESKRQRLDNQDSDAGVTRKMRKMRKRSCPLNPLKPQLEDQYARLWIRIRRLEDELASDDDDDYDYVCSNLDGKSPMKSELVPASNEHTNYGEIAESKDAEVMRKMRNKRCPPNPLKPQLEEQYARLLLQIGRVEEKLASDDVSDDVCLNSEYKKAGVETFSGPVVVAKGEEKRPRDEEDLFIDMEEFFIEREKDGGPILEAEACCELNNYRLCDILDYY